jgi:hypothetical protein
MGKQHLPWQQEPATGTPSKPQVATPDNPKAKEAPQSYNFANYYLNTPDFDSDAENQMADLHQRSYQTNRSVSLPKDEEIRKSLRERLGSEYKDGYADQVLRNIKKNYERYEKGRFNALRTSYYGTPDTFFNQRQGYITTKEAVDHSAEDLFAKEAGLTARKGAVRYTGQTPEQMLAENFDRARSEETTAAKFGQFERNQAEDQLAKEKSKQRGYVLVGTQDWETGNTVPKRDEQGRPIYNTAPLNPLQYGYTSTIGEDGVPILMQVEKADLATHRGSLLNVNDILPSRAESTIAQAVFKAGDSWLGQLDERMKRKGARYEIESENGGVGRSLTNYLGHMSASAARTAAGVAHQLGNMDEDNQGRQRLNKLAGLGGYTFDPEAYEKTMLLRANNEGANTNLDMRGSAFSNLPSFLNATSQLTAQLTQQTAFGVFGGGAGLAVTALDSASSGYYEGRKNGLSDTEASVYGALTGALAFGAGKLLQGQAFSKLSSLLRKGASSEVNALLRTEVSGLAQSLAAQAEAKGMQLTVPEIAAAVEAAKPKLIEKFSLGVGQLYDKWQGLGSSAGGAFALGIGEEVVDEAVDTGHEELTKQAVRFYLQGNEDGRPDWVKQSIKDGTNEFSAKSVTDIMDSAVEAGLLGGIGGGLTTGPISSVLAQNNRRRVADLERLNSLGQTEAISRYLVENDFSAKAVNGLQAELQNWRDQGKLGARLRPDGSVTDQSSETENEIMYRSLSNKITSLTELAKQTDLLRHARGEGQGALVEQLNAALGREKVEGENFSHYERVQEGLSHLLTLTQARRDVTQVAQQTALAVQRAKNPQLAETAGVPGDDGTGQHITAPAAPDANGDGIVAPAFDADGGAFGGADPNDVAEEAKPEKKDAKKKKKPGAEGAEGEGDEGPTAPSATGKDTPVLVDGREKLEELSKELGPAGGVVQKYAENLKAQLDLKTKLLATEPENVEERARVRQELAKLQDQQDKLDSEITTLAAQEPAVGSLRQLADAQYQVEVAAARQKELFDGTLTSYQVQEGSIRLQQAAYQRALDKPRKGTSKARVAQMQRALDAMGIAATNPETGRVDAAYLRQQLVENEEYVARRRFSPLTSGQAGTIAQAQGGAVAVQALSAALASGDAASIETALAGLETATPGNAKISVLDSAQAGEAQALLDRHQKLDQRGERDARGEASDSPALRVQPPATPQSKPLAQQMQEAAAGHEQVAQATEQAVAEVEEALAAFEADTELPEATPTPVQDPVESSPAFPNALPTLGPGGRTVPDAVPESMDRDRQVAASNANTQNPKKLRVKRQASQRIAAWESKTLRQVRMVAGNSLRALLMAEKQIRQSWSPQLETALSDASYKLDSFSAALADYGQQAREWGWKQVGVPQTEAAVAGLRQLRQPLVTAGRAFTQALTHLGNTLRTHVASLREIGQAATTIAQARLTQGVRVLLDQLRHLHYENLLKRLQPLTSAGAASLAKIRRRLRRTAISLATGAPAPAAAIGGVTSAPGQESAVQVQNLRDALSAWQQQQQDAIRAQEDHFGQALTDALASGDEAVMHQALAFFGRDIPEASGDVLRQEAEGVAGEFEREEIGAPSYGAVAERVGALLGRLQDPEDLRTLQGTDPDEQAEIDYLTGRFGIPRELDNAISYHLSNALSADESQKANFVGLQRKALVELQQAALRNYGLAIYRLRVVPLLKAQNALTLKPGAMGLKELPEGAAGQILAKNEALLGKASLLLSLYDQLGSNRYRDDDQQLQSAVRGHYDRLTALLDTPTLSADTPELKAMRTQVRTGLSALLTKLDGEGATLSDLDAADQPLRTLLRAQPELATQILESWVAADVKTGKPLYMLLAKLAETKDGTEQSPLAHLSELLGAPRTEIAAARQAVLVAERGQGPDGSALATEKFQLSLEQEMVLQSALSFLTADHLPLATLIAKTPGLHPVLSQGTGLVVPAAGSVFVINGKPGTGKTFLIQSLLGTAARLLGGNVDVLVSAPHAPQRHRMEQVIGTIKGVSTTTVEPDEIIKRLRSGDTLPQRVIVVDEVTALGTSQARELVAEVENYNRSRNPGEQVKVFLAGDPLQLPGTSESGQRSDEGHPLISQSMALLRARPLRQIYRSGRVTLHEGLDVLGKRILSGIDQSSALASDTTPVPGRAYSKLGNATTLEGWTYYSAADQRKEIVELAQALTASGGLVEGKPATLRVLVSPGEEQAEIDALKAAGLTENQAAGLVFSATDPRLQTVLNYDQSQGGDFDYAYVAVGDEQFASNALRALFVGTSRAKRYTSVRLAEGETYTNTRELATLPQYQDLSGAQIQGRNQLINQQLHELAGANPAPQAQAQPTPGAGPQAQPQDPADAETASDEDADGDAPTADEQAALDEQKNAEAPAGTTPASDEAEPVDNEGAKVVRNRVETTLELVAGLLSPELAVHADDLDQDDNNLLDELLDPLSPTYALHVQALGDALRKVQLLVDLPELDKLVGKPTADLLRASEGELTSRLREMQRAVVAATADAVQVDPALVAGQLVPQLAEQLGEGRAAEVGFVLETEEGSDGLARPVSVRYTSPTLDAQGEPTGQVSTEGLSAQELAGLTPTEAMRKVRDFVLHREAMLKDLVYHLKNQVATKAALRQRVIVHSYALPTSGPDGPTPQQKTAKNGFIRQLFNKLTVAARTVRGDLTDEVNAQPLQAADFNGLQSEQGGIFSGGGEFRLRFVPTFQHNYLGWDGEDPSRRQQAEANRFVVEYAEGDQVLTVGAVRADAGATPGRVRAVAPEAQRQDTPLDVLLGRVAAGEFGPQGVTLGQQVIVEGWRNSRRHHPKRFQLDYADRYPLSQLSERLALEGKGLSSVYTVTTPSTRQVHLGSNYQLHKGGINGQTGNGLSGRQIVFISHANLSPAEIDQEVQRALAELIEQVTGLAERQLYDLNNRELSAVMQGLLEQYDLQLVPLSQRDLSLGDYGHGLRSTVNENGQASTFRAPATAESLDKLLSTKPGEGVAEVLPRYAPGETRPLPWNAGRNALMGSLFTAEQARATTRDGRSKSDPYDYDERRPGLLNTVRAALFEGGVISMQASDEGGQAMLTEAVTQRLTPAQQTHLIKLIQYHQKFWLPKGSSRVSAGYLQDLLLYLEYLDNKGLPISKAWQDWQADKENQSLIQFNGYVPKGLRMGGKAPLFVKTVFPPGFEAGQVLTTQYATTAEPSFQLNLSRVAQDLGQAPQARPVQIAPQQPAPAVEEAPVTPVPPAPTAEELAGDDAFGDVANEVPLDEVEAALPELTDMDGGQSEAEPALEDTDVLQSQAVPPPPPVASEEEELVPDNDEFGDFDVSAYGDDDYAMNLRAGIVSNPEPLVPEAVWADVNYVLGEDYPREQRTAIVNKQGVPVDYTEILGRFFRGVIELNELPGGLLSRVAGRHEPLHAIMAMLPADRRQAVLDAARRRMAQEGVASPAQVSDTDVEEWLADKFVQLWPEFQKSAEAYRSSKLVKALQKNQWGQAVLRFLEGIRATYGRLVQRQDAIDTLFSQAHRGHFLGAMKRLANAVRQDAPARYASAELSTRKDAYEALSTKLKPGVLHELERHVGTMLYGHYVYRYQSGRAPISVQQGLKLLRDNYLDNLVKGYQKVALTNAEVKEQLTPKAITAARQDIGTAKFLTHPAPTRQLALATELAEKADESLAPGKTWMDVLLAHRYSFEDQGQSDAYADAEARPGATDNDANHGAEDGTTLSGADQQALGGGIQQRDSHLIDKERESLEGQRLLRQLEAVPALVFEGGMWKHGGTSRVLTQLNTVRAVLHQAYNDAKASSREPMPTYHEVGLALAALATPQSEFGIAAASLLARFFNAPDATGKFPLTIANQSAEIGASGTPSFRQLAAGVNSPWAKLVQPVLSELHSFFATVERREMVDADFDALNRGHATALRNPVTSAADQKKNVTESTIFVHAFTREGSGYRPNLAPLQSLATAGLKLRLIGGVLQVTHPSLPRPVLEIGVGTETGSEQVQHVGGFGSVPQTLPLAEAAKHWTAMTPLVQKLAAAFGLSATFNGDLVRALLTEYQAAPQQRDYTDFGGARTNLGTALAKIVGQALTAHLAQPSAASRALLESVFEPDPAAVAAPVVVTEGEEPAAPDKLAPLLGLLHTEGLLTNTHNVNGFLSRKEAVQGDANLLSPTVYWPVLRDLLGAVQRITPEREVRNVRNDRNQKKATYRNTTALYPVTRLLKRLAKLSVSASLSPTLASLAYLRNPQGGYVNRLADGSWNLSAVREFNVLVSRYRNKRKSLVKASAQELHEYNFWGNFLGGLAGSGETAVMNVPRSDKPTQKDFVIGLGDKNDGTRPVAVVSQGADGLVVADAATRQLVGELQQSVRSKMTYDSYQRFTQALNKLEKRPVLPYRTPAERNEQRTPEGQAKAQQQRAELKALRQKLTAAREAAYRAVAQGEDGAEIKALEALRDVYNETLKYLYDQDGRGYWVQSASLDGQVDAYPVKQKQPDGSSKLTGFTYGPKVLEVALLPKEQFIDNELASLPFEAADVLDAGLTYMPDDLANRAYAALTGGSTEEANTALAGFRKDADGSSYRLRVRGAEGTPDVYNPLVLSHLLTNRVLTHHIEEALNGSYLYYKNHADLAKRAISRETPIELQDQEHPGSLKGELGLIGFEDTNLGDLHDPAAMATRYTAKVAGAAGPDGKIPYLDRPLAVAPQDARQQSALLLGMLTLEQAGQLLPDTTQEQVLAAGLKVLNGTQAQDGLSSMNVLQYRMEARGYGDKYVKERAMQKNIITGRNHGSSVLGKTASYIFTNDILALGNEYMQAQFIASMGGPTSTPMKAFLQARTELKKLAKDQGETGAEWYTQQLAQEKDWDRTEQILAEWEKTPEHAGWRKQISLTGYGSMRKIGAVGLSAPLDQHAGYNRVAMQVLESGRILSLHADAANSTIARITQEEHIPALLGENFKTAAEVYGFLEELARENLLRLDDLMEKAKAEATALGKSEPEAARAYLYKQLEKLMRALDQRGTTLSAVEQNLDPNLTLLQQQLQTAIAGAVNAAVSKLRFKGVRASVVSASGLVNMYEVVERDPASGKVFSRKRMTRADLLAAQTKKGKKLAGLSPLGDLLLAPMFTQGAGMNHSPFDVQVDELRFMHVTDAAGRALSPDETADLYRTLRLAERGDAGAVAQLAAWGIGTDSPQRIIQPAEIMLPRSVLAPFLSQRELQKFSAADVQGLTPGYFARKHLRYLNSTRVSKGDKALLEQLRARAGQDGHGSYEQQVAGLAVARGQQIHENLQQALAPKGTRIPVTNLNSMQVFKIAGFFDSHANTVLVPSELLTISGADNDGDQITLEYFDADKHGLSELAHGLPDQLPDAATVQQLLGKQAPAAATSALDDSAADKIEQQEEAEHLSEQQAPAEQVAADAEADATTAQEPEEVAGEQKLPEVLRQPVAKIRRSLFKKKKSVLADVRNLLDMFNPINFSELAEYREEAIRQQGEFAKQRLGADAPAKRAGFTKGAYELVSNVLLHLANQAGKTGVGPFVKARELADVARMLSSTPGAMNFAFPFVFLGKTTTSLEGHWRQVSQQLEKLANAALDNAKEGLLGHLNINEHTWSVVSAGIIGGMSFPELIPTVNHFFMRQVVAGVVKSNHIGKKGTVSLLKRLTNQLTYEFDRQEQTDDEQRQPPKRGWYMGEEGADTATGLFQLVHNHQAELVQELDRYKREGHGEQEAWLLSYGFTPENLKKGTVTRFVKSDNPNGTTGIVVGETELLKPGNAQEGTEEEAVRRYIIEQNYLLAQRGQEMRDQIGLLAVLSGISTNDYDASKQAEKTANALGLNPTDPALAQHFQALGDYMPPTAANPAGRGTLPKAISKKAAFTFPVASFVQGHGYLRAAIGGLGRDMALRQELLLRRMPELGHLLDLAVKSGYGFVKADADTYQWSRTQLERTADLAYVQANQLRVDQKLLTRYPQVATELAAINRAAELGQHTIAGQEMLRRTIARLLQRLNQEPTNAGVLAGAGRSGVIKLLQFSADGRRLLPELRGGTELTPDQKTQLEAEADALPLLTKQDPAAGALVQQLLLYYQLTGGGLRLGRGQLTEILPASVLGPVSQHRRGLIDAWRAGIKDVIALEKEERKQAGKAEKALAETLVPLPESEQEEPNADAEPAESDAAGLPGEAVAASDELAPTQAQVSTEQGGRMRAIARLLGAHANPAVHVLKGLFSQYAMPLARPEWLPTLEWKKPGNATFDNQNPDPVYDKTFRDAKTTAELPATVGAERLTLGVGGRWAASAKRASYDPNLTPEPLPRYVQSRNTNTAGNHVYAALELRGHTEEVPRLAPVWARLFPTGPADAVSWNQGQRPYSYLPVLDNALVTEGRVSDPTQLPDYAAHQAAVQLHAEHLAERLAPVYEALGEVPETAEQLLARLPQYAFGHQQMVTEQTRTCTD